MKPPVEQPAETAANQDARNQFGDDPEPGTHRVADASLRSSRTLDLAATKLCGKLVEPRSKGGFIVRRVFGTFGQRSSPCSWISREDYAPLVAPKNL